MSIVKVYAHSEYEDYLLAEFQYESLFSICKPILKEECRLREATLRVEVFNVKEIISGQEETINTKY